MPLEVRFKQLVSALGTILEQGLTDRIRCALRCPASEQHNLLLRSDLGIHRLQTHLEHVERGPCGDNHWGRVVVRQCLIVEDVVRVLRTIPQFLGWDLSLEVCLTDPEKY